MPFTINSRILLGLASIVAAGALVIGATFAYFSDTETSSNNVLTAGTLDISLDQSMQAINPVISNWAPGEITHVRFDIHNIGNLPVNFRALAIGSWNFGPSDPTLVKVTEAQYYDEGSSSWITFASNLGGLTGYVYYSPDGSSAALWPLAGGATEQFQLTVLFDSSAGNSYQGKTFTASLTANAKQTNAPSF